MLIAKQPILYQNRMYEAGETLPTYDTHMVKAWLDSGSAIDRSENIAAEAEIAPAASVEVTPEDKPEPKKATTRKKK